MNILAYENLLKDIVSKIPIEYEVSVSSFIEHNRGSNSAHCGFYIRVPSQNIGYLNITDGGVYVYLPGGDHARIVLADPSFSEKLSHTLLNALKIRRTYVD